jgi:hypothetical protein
MTDRSAYSSGLSDGRWSSLRRCCRARVLARRPVGGRRLRWARWSTGSCIWTGPVPSWRQLPHNFPHWRTVYGLFRGLGHRLHPGRGAPGPGHQCRHAEGRHADASAGAIDSQSRAAMTPANASTAASATSWSELGLLLVIIVTAASVQDRDGGLGLLGRLKRASGRLRLVWADGAYAGKLVTWAPLHSPASPAASSAPSSSTGPSTRPRTLSQFW